MNDNGVMYQTSTACQIPDYEEEFAERRMLVMKLEEDLLNAEKELEAEEAKVIQFKNTVHAADGVVIDAKKMVTYFSLALLSVTKSIARTQQTGNQALKNIEKQEPMVAKAKEKVHALSEELENARLALKTVEETIYGVNIAPLDCEGDDASSCASSSHSVCEQCL